MHIVVIVRSSYISEEDYIAGAVQFTEVKACDISFL